MALVVGVYLAMRDLRENLCSRIIIGFFSNFIIDLTILLLGRFYIGECNYSGKKSIITIDTK